MNFISMNINKIHESVIGLEATLYPSGECQKMYIETENLFGQVWQHYLFEVLWEYTRIEWLLFEEASISWKGFQYDP